MSQNAPNSALSLINNKKGFIKNTNAITQSLDARSSKDGREGSYSVIQKGK